MKRHLLILAVLCVALLLPSMSHARQVYFGDASLSFVKGHPRRIVNKKLKAELTFDREGHMLSKTVNGKPVKFVTERDSRGLPVRVGFNSEIMGTGGNEHTFAEDGALLEMRCVNAAGKLIYRRVYTYDSNRNCTGYIELMRGEEMPAVIDDSDRRRVLYKTLESDSHGNVLKRQICSLLLDAEEEYEIEYY